jgi:hypothetical protein
MHGFLKIFSKVIAEELKMREARPTSMGYTSLAKESLRGHEFNAKFVCAIGDALSRRFNKAHGDSKSWMTHQFSKRLLSRDVCKLATMKKSAAGDLQREEHMRDSGENKRISCLEASVRLMERGKDSKVMKQVGTLALEIQNEYGGLVSNLFKKFQNKDFPYSSNLQFLE